MGHAVSIVWFQRDFRLADNPALLAAVERGGVIPVYIHAPQEQAPWQPGAASNWWLHHSLAALAKELQARGSRLLIRRGPSAQALISLCRESGARYVIWNRSYDPAFRSLDQAIVQQLTNADIDAQRCHPPLLFPRGRVLTQSDTPYKVFTPFWRKCLTEGLDDSPLPDPAQLPAVAPLNSLILDDLGLLPKIAWDSEFHAHWQPGEAHAHQQLERFCQHHLAEYADSRDTLANDTTSRLSPHLHFGEITPRQIIAHVQRTTAHETRPGLMASTERFFAELGWREFAHNVLYYSPQTTEQPLNPSFGEFPWRRDETQLTAWQRGTTGIPVVDAGMRQLWRTGTMHNRVRMITASFLTKNCRIHWLEGARWFWDTLLDADLAANTLNWQWVAGCGADAAPYFRIFNPVGQSRKFDPEGRYLRRWLPELSPLPNRYIHAPWEAPAATLTAAGLTLGKQYPRPLLDLKQSRQQALDAYQTLGTPTVAI